jgi:hypothetical protein
VKNLWIIILVIEQFLVLVSKSYHVHSLLGKSDVVFALS